MAADFAEGGQPHGVLNGNNERGGRGEIDTPVFDPAYVGEEVDAPSGEDEGPCPSDRNRHPAGVNGPGQADGVFCDAGAGDSFSAGEGRDAGNSPVNGATRKGRK